MRFASVPGINLIVDTGPAAFQPKFQQLASQIAANKERIDLLILTHTDNDHIKGCTRYLQSLGEKIIDRVWMNGFREGANLGIQEHTAKQASVLSGLLNKNGIAVIHPVSEGYRWDIHGVKLEVIGPTAKELEAAAEAMPCPGICGHAQAAYWGNIKDASDIYKPDTSPTNRSSIIFTVEFEGKKLLFTGDSPSESLERAISRHCPHDTFEVVKLPHHGSPRNVSRELIRKLHADKFIISSNKRIDKTLLRRFAEEKGRAKFLLNYDSWQGGYFTENDMQKYVSKDKITVQYIGEEKIVL